MTHYVFVGYRYVKVLPGKDEDAAVIEPDTDLHDYTFAEVFLVDPRYKKVLQFTGGPDKPLVSLRVRNYLFKAYADAIAVAPAAVPAAQVKFVGFAPQLFLRLLGCECSLPAVSKPLPLSLWQSDNYCDLYGILACRRPASLLKILQRRKPADEQSGKAWDMALKDWKEPGLLPLQDARIALELSAQLGLLV